MKKETEANAPAPVSPELLERARAHDRQALTELYEATKLEIYRCIHAMVRDEELTLDIQQDSYLQAFSHLDQLREPESFLPWLRQIAVNQARAQLRRRRPTLFTELREDGEPEPELPDLRPEASPELALDRKETARLVREILDGLPDGQRLILGMYYYENIPIRQIAEDTGLSQGTVKAQLFKGRSRVEQEVRQLEAKGVKLYGLSPLPFLLALLKRSEPAAEAGERVLAGVLPQAAESAAVHVGRGFFQTTLGRVTLGVLAAAALGGGAAGWRWARTHFPVGDNQPPTAVESAEDLGGDSREDLQTEPVTTELTEPVTTEPTEPVVTETTEPVTTQPTEPKSTEPAGTAPGPSEPRPTQPGPTEPAPRPTEPAPTEPASTEPAGLRAEWAWDTGSGMDWTVSADENGFGEPRILTAVLPVGQKPELYAEDESVVAIKKVDYNAFLDRTQSADSGGWSSRCQWRVTPLAEGSTRIHCAVGGQILKTLTVTVQVPVKLLNSSVTESSPFYENTEKTMANCAVGMEYQLGARVLGGQSPVFSTDNEAVVRLGTVSGGDGGHPARSWQMPVRIVGAGDAHIFLSLNGKVERTWTVHAVSVTVDRSDSQEDLLPVDAEPQIMSWYANHDHMPVVIRQGGSDSLYVKVKGSEAPVISLDDPGVAAVSPEELRRHEDRNVTEYWYKITALRAGVCTLRCSFGGVQIFLVPIVVP